MFLHTLGRMERHSPLHGNPFKKGAKGPLLFFKPFLSFFGGRGERNRERRDREERKGKSWRRKEGFHPSLSILAFSL